MSNTEKCVDCGKGFSVIEFPMGVPGGKEKEPINCPYCGCLQRESMTDGWFSISKIEKD